MRVGLLGGTFDPIHVGHLLIAEIARYALSLDQVVFVPAGDPPHKGDAVSDSEHRHAMVLLATASNEAFVVSRHELDRSGPSYSLATVREFRHELGPESELFFIAGADAVLEIRTWHRWEELFRECRFIALARPGFDMRALEAVLPAELLAQVHLLPAPGFDLSSTMIRERVARGEPVRYLVTEAVDAYIRKHGLYR
jgi:nicotinate-nucleotide adenylyltransferase